MAKGMFTQGIAVLTSSVPALDDVERVLRNFTILGRPAINAIADSWMGGYPALLLDWLPEHNGKILVDLVDRPWPDHMGDPNSASTVFGAWAMGWFGPHVSPGNLERALVHSYAWTDAEAAVRAHGAFIRVKSSYVFGTGLDARVLPPDYDPATELGFLTDVARALMTLPEALAFFNPNGELLLSAKSLEETLVHDSANRLTPLDVWTNVRMMNPGNGWVLMDTVGMSQLDLPDLEACFPLSLVEAGAVAAFLRDVSLYIFRKGQVIAEGDTVNGPGGRWRARHAKNGLAAPPRPTLRWFPEAASAPPPALLLELQAT